MSSSGLNEIKHRLREFAQARHWNQFHSPKNLSMALSAEVAEIVEHLTNHGCSNVVGTYVHGWTVVEQCRSYCRGRTGTTQWLTEEQSKTLPKDKLAEVETELADTFIYLIRLADKLDIDLLKAADSKIKINEQKYPVEKARGNAKKYTEFDA